MAINRSEVPEQDCWNLSSLYPNLEAWQETFESWARPNQTPHWPELTAYKGRLGESPSVLKEFLDQQVQVNRQISKLYTFARLKHDEETSNNDSKLLYGKITAIVHELQHGLSWWEPELLSLNADQLQSYLKSPELKDYRIYLEKVVRFKPHTLTADQEALMVLSGRALQASYMAFGALDNSDLTFGTVKDSQGSEHELTHSRYGLYLQNPDRTLRKNSFLQLHESYKNHGNTLCELLQGTVQAHLFDAKARSYSCCLEAALFPNQIDMKVYQNLLNAVHERLDYLHRYVKLRAQFLPDIDKIHLYDLQVPLTAPLEAEVPYEEAVKLVVDSVAPLGSEYQNCLRSGLTNLRWVDRYENRAKRSGAYSGGCYDSQPYILMNYNGSIRDLFVLAHEAGHSMHSYLSNSNQPYQDSSYSIFIAEIASTFNEELLQRYLLKQAKSNREKLYLICRKLDDLRATLFRQTQFAEFELFIHQKAEAGQPLTPAILCEEYRRLNRLYYGPDIELDPVSDYEWARIPHFYYNFYVYQYATGVSAALTLADRVLRGEGRDRYINMLEGGSSRYPLDLLNQAGVDLTTPDPIRSAIDQFGRLLVEAEQILQSPLGQ